MIHPMSEPGGSILASSPFTMYVKNTPAGRYEIIVDWFSSRPWKIVRSCGIGVEWHLCERRIGDMPAGSGIRGIPVRELPV